MRIGGLTLSSFLTVAAAAAEHSAQHMPGEYGLIVAAFGSFLTHVLSHWTAAEAETVLAGFEGGENNDLEFALAAAYREALRKIRQDAERQKSLGAEDLAAIDRWVKLIDENSKTAEEASWLFTGKDPVDPAEAAAKPDVWRDIRGLLARWSDEQDLPSSLDACLRARLPGEIQTALERVIRQPRYGRGWIAWQESFLRATHRDVVEIKEIVKEIREEVRKPAKPPKPADVEGYLRTLWNATRHIEIKNLRTSDGSANTFDIDKLYTPLTTVLPHDLRDRDKEREAQRMERTEVPLQEALEQPRLLLVGDPGAGKTTFLRRIAFEACHTLLHLDAKRGVERMLPDPCRFPVLIRAEYLAKHISASQPHQRGALADETSPEWLFDYLGGAYPEVGAEHFREEFRKGCLLLVDGLDEVPGDAARNSIAQVLKSAAERYGPARIVATSRPGIYGGVTRIGQFSRMDVAPLSDEAIETFAEKWGQAVHPGDGAEAQKLTHTLLDEVNAKPEIRRMAGNPVMLTALACLHFTHATLPEQRSELYNSVLEWLAKARQAKTKRDHHTLLALMRKLAHAMHTGAESKRTEIERDEAIGVLAPEFQEEKGAARQTEAAGLFLDAEEVNSGIIVNDGAKLRFWHPTFQEALAAYELAYDPSERQRLLFEEDKLNDPQWRETVLLLAGELKKLGNKPVNDFLDKVLAGAPRGVSQKERVLGCVCCAGLMGALLNDLAAWKYTLTESLDARYQKVLREALSIFDAGQTKLIRFEARLEAAEALGRAGDSRLMKDNWVRVEGGEFWMGAQAKNERGRNYDPEADGNEAPVRQCNAVSFLMARYPVTVTEYERFVEAGGYSQRRFWNAGGFGDFKEPEKWAEQRRYPNRPVTSVSWYEASAYCAWLAGRTPGVRLPKEEEWECAARCGREACDFLGDRRNPINTEPTVGTRARRKPRPQWECTRPARRLTASRTSRVTCGDGRTPSTVVQRAGCCAGALGS